MKTLTVVTGANHLDQSLHNLSKEQCEVTNIDYWYGSRPFIQVVIEFKLPEINTTGHNSVSSLFKSLDK